MNTPSPKRIEAIDLVRTVAVLAVLCGHLGILYRALPSEFPLLQKLWYKLWVGGAYGVSMFFVVSGYLITRLIAQGQGGLFRPDFRDFYARRVGRIIPLLVLVSFLGLALITFVKDPSPAFQHCFGEKGVTFGAGFWFSIAAFWENWYQLFVPISGLHWIVLWSLSVEEQFYFFYPLCLKWLGGERRLGCFLSFLVLLGPVSRWAFSVFFHNPTTAQVQFNSFSGFGLIATGGLLYLVSERSKASLAGNRRLCWQLTILGLLIVCRIYLEQPYFADRWGGIVNHSLLGGGLFLFLLGALRLDFFKSRFIALLSLPGKWSYGMYLFQATTLCFLWDLLGKQREFPAFLTYSLVTALVAYLSYRFFETPANLFLRGFLGQGIGSENRN